MNARLDQILDDALALEPADRSAVAVALLDSVDGEDTGAVAKAWAEEIRKRKDRLASGESMAVPWADAKARLNAL